MAGDLSVLTQQWAQRALSRFGLQWGVDSTRPWDELALRGMLSGAHLGIERVLRLGKVRREIRNRGEMRCALWRIPVPSSSKTPRRGKILWVPGLGDTPISWLAVAFAAASRKGFDELVLLDFPGFHGSLAHSRCITGIDRFFEIASDVVKELRPEVVVGHSLGGWLASKAAAGAAAAAAGEGVQKLVLLSPSGICGGPDERALWNLEFRSFVEVPDVHEYGNRLFARVPPGWSRVGGLFLPFLSREDTREFLDSVEARHFLDEGASADLARLAGMEIELLWGERDRVVPSRFGAEWVRALPQSKLTLWPDIGHMPHLESPVRLVRWLGERISG